MKTLAFVPLVLAAGVLLVAPRDTNNPKEIVQQIAAMKKALDDKISQGQTVDIAAEQAKIQQFIVSSVGKVDVNKIDGDDAYDWVPLFRQANKTSEANALLDAADRATSWKMFQIDSETVGKLLGEGKLVQAEQKIRNMGFFGGPSLVGHFHVGVRRQLFDLAKDHSREVEKIYDVLIDRIHFDNPLSENDKKWRIAAYGDVAATKYLAINHGGQKNAALKGLRELETAIAKAGKSDDGHGNNPLKTVQDAIAEVNGTAAKKPDLGAGSQVLVGKTAPEIVFDRRIGSFTGLAALRGKVVLLDFMAHWCGPCKAALPSIEKLQKDNPTTVQVISLTGYYGYYGNVKDLSPSKEFDLMKSFATNFKISWPIVFDGSGGNSKAYGVSGIPQLVVIDKKGVVRKVEIGFDPTSFELSKQLVARLVAE